MRRIHSQLKGTRSRVLRQVAFGARLLVPMVALLTSQAMAGEKPSGPEKALRVLPAGVENAVESAFKRAGPAWTLKTAKVDKVAVTATVCALDGTCHTVVLSDPKSACKGKVAGPWCVTWTGAAPADPSALTSALAKDPDATMWRTIAARPKQPEIMEPVADAPGATRTGSAPGGSGGKAGGAGGAGSAKAGGHAHHNDNGAGGGEGHKEGGPDEGGSEGSNNTILLLVALVAAGAATFVLFRGGNDDDDEDAPPAA